MTSREANAADMALMSEAYAIAAQTPEIQISVSKMTRAWCVEVGAIALKFDDSAASGKGLVPMVKAAKAAYDAYIQAEDELDALEDEGEKQR